jgi:hypothetical protein
VRLIARRLGVERRRFGRRQLRPQLAETRLERASSSRHASISRAASDSST